MGRSIKIRLLHSNNHCFPSVELQFGVNNNSNQLIEMSVTNQIKQRAMTLNLET